VRPTLELTAHAKLNLTLKVVGRRADGLHLLDGLTAFCEFGDKIRIETRVDRDSLHLTGPFATRVEGENIVSRTLDLYRDATGLMEPIAIEIEKNIPIAAGLGGGSSDAAAVLRGLQKIYEAPLNPDTLRDLALSLGADVPVCLACKSAWMRGIGERLSNAGPLPPMRLVLVNPGIALTAGAVFRRYQGPYSALSPRFPDHWDEAGIILYIGETSRNDLMETAIFLVPMILRVLSTMAAHPGVRCVGMSGSGATCFAIMESGNERDTQMLLDTIRAEGWWVTATALRP
jgi:4-diphosphocytidyl-2-C-methyl-D-erythritol kinase